MKNNLKIRLAADLQSDSIVDGLGIRTVIWTQGCKHFCPGCHNPSTFSFDDGELFDVDVIKEKIANLKYQDGITFSGGDPFYQPEACADIAKYVHTLNMNVWCFTGYTFEELLDLCDPNVMAFLKEVDVLIDGPFMREKKSFDIKFRGSSNQRIIDVQKSLQAGKVITINLDDEEENHNYGREDHKLYI